MRIRQTVSKSSIENHSLCELQFFYSYNLGYRSEGGLRTVMGSALHGVMEALMMMKLDMQGPKTGKITHEEMGEISYTEEEYWETRELSNSEVDEINKSRINKSTYIDQKKLPYGTIRTGEKLVRRLTDLSEQVYLSRFDLKPADKRDLWNFVNMTLETFDPRPHKVIAVELPFDIPLPYEWAKIPGTDDYVRIKGFIDLILEIDNDYYIYDYKSGQRKDFNSGEKKTYKKMKEDLQLQIYVHILKMLYPDKNIFANLLYVRDGGLFTMFFDDDVSEKVETEIKRHIEQVKNTKIPRLLDPTRSDFRCRTLCSACKNRTFDKNVSDCQFLISKIHEIGLDAVEEQYHKDRFVKFEV